MKQDKRNINNKKNKPKHGTPKSAGNEGFRKHNRLKFMKTERIKRMRG